MSDCEPLFFHNHMQALILHCYIYIYTHNTHKPDFSTNWSCPFIMAYLPNLSIPDSGCQFKNKETDVVILYPQASYQHQVVDDYLNNYCQLVTTVNDNLETLIEQWTHSFFNYLH